MPASDDLTVLAPAATLPVISQLAEIPEEEIWLAKQKSARTGAAIILRSRRVSLRPIELPE
jgi:hypothetical protein